MLVRWFAGSLIRWFAGSLGFLPVNCVVVYSTLRLLVLDVNERSQKLF